MKKLLLFLLCCAVCVVVGAATNQPNIIIIFADDMGYSDIGCYGGEIDTPNIDSIATDGLRFRNFYNTARCTPSRAAILTGRYGQQAGIGHLNEFWDTPGYIGYINSKSVTIAEVLKDAGYFTAMAGKWHVGNDRPHWAIDRGFDRAYHIPNGGGVYFEPFEKDRSVYLDDTLIDPLPADFYSTKNFTDYGLQFIDEALSAEKPFFLYMAYIAPHDSLETYKEDVDKYLNRGTYSSGWEPVRTNRLAAQKAEGGIAESLNGTLGEWNLSATDADNSFTAWESLTASSQTNWVRRMSLYAGVLDRMDQNIGRLLDKLDDPDGNPGTNDSIADNTIVIFLSDNGGNGNTGGDFGDGTIGYPDFGNTSAGVSYGKVAATLSNTPFRRWKSKTHEGGVMTPCVVRWPDGISHPGGTVLTNRAHLIDLMATCVDIGKADYPTNYNGNEIGPMEGVSLAPVFTNTGSLGRSNPLFFEHEGNLAIIDGDWKLVAKNNSAWELYNLAEDSQELNDLSSTYPSLVSSMSDAWYDWAHDANVKDYPPNNLKRISLTPSVDQAAVSGPVEGRFSLSQSGSGAVNVYLDASGTALAGVDYSALSSIYSLSDATPTNLSVVPLPGGVTRESKTVEVTVKPRYWYREPWSPETITISPDTYDTWAATNLPSSTYDDLDRLPTADPDGDGAPNYLERARGTDPTVADPAGSEVWTPTMSEPEPGYFTFNFTEDPGVPEVDWKVWLSDDLSSWRDGAGEMVMNRTPTGMVDLVSMVWTQSVSNAEKQFAKLQWNWQGGPLGDPVLVYAFSGGSGAANTVPNEGSATAYDPRTATFPSSNQSGISSGNEHTFVRSNGTTNSLDAAIDIARYHDCSVTFDAANPTTVLGLSFDHKASSSAGFESSIAVFVSTNGFPVEPDSGDVLAVSTIAVPAGQSATASLGDDPLVDLSSLGLETFVGTLSIRLYFYDDSGSSDNITRLDNLTINGVETVLAQDETLAEYLFDGGSRASTDSSSVTANDYVGGSIGVPPSETRNPSAGIVAYSTGLDTTTSDTHSFAVDFGAVAYNLSQLSYDYYATRIAFNNSTFSYELTSDATGATILASEEFTSSSGGQADFSVEEVVDLSAHPAFQGITGTVTFSFTFTDNSNGSNRSHGIDNVELLGLP